MEIVRPQSKTLSVVGVTTIPTYRSAPAMEVRLDDFELYAIDRLRVLRAISDGLCRGKKPEEMEKLVEEMWKANMRHLQSSEVINKDVISHFALRLVYCRSDDLRKWFLSMETTLFRYRFKFQSIESQKALMAEFDLPYKFVTAAEFESVKDKLGQVARSIGQHLSTVDAIFFKVPFEEVPELVANRRVYISKGNAYVAMNQVGSLMVTKFRSLLSKALLLTNRKWTTTICQQEKDRIVPIVEALATRYLGPDYSQPSSSEISVQEIDQVAKSSFPLCMRHLLDKLREDHHLKHGGRIQFGLFLKGVGLKLDDALAFWRAEFSQKVGSERFDREYAYIIRHNYGKEGKRTDYTPYSCQKIISTIPAVGNYHGCPYRHFSEENLRAAVCRMGVTGSVVEDIMDKVKNKHYQVACTLAFEAVHGCSIDSGISHPNQYFADSQKIRKSKV